MGFRVSSLRKLWSHLGGLLGGAIESNIKTDV